MPHVGASIEYTDPTKACPPGRQTARRRRRVRARPAAGAACLPNRPLCLQATEASNQVATVTPGPGPASGLAVESRDGFKFNYQSLCSERERPQLVT